MSGNADFRFLPYPMPSLTDAQTLTTITRSSLVQMLSSSITTPPRPATSTTPTATTLQRAITTVTVRISSTPTPTPSSPAGPIPRDPVYGDLTATYIILLFVPVVVLMIAAFSQWRDSRRRVYDQDIEMQPYQKFWFPWRELDDGEEPNEVSPGSSSSQRKPSQPRVPHSTLWPPSAWESEDGTITRGGTPSWGRRHTFLEVRRYPSTMSPRPSSRGFEEQRVEGGGDSRLVVERGARRRVMVQQASDEDAAARQSIAVDIVDGGRASMVTNDDAEQIYGRTGSRRNTATDESLPAPPQPRTEASAARDSGDGNRWSNNGIPSYYKGGSSPNFNRYELSSDSESDKSGKPQEKMSEKRAGKQPVRS